MPIDYLRLRASVTSAVQLAGTLAVLERPGAATGDDWDPVAGEATQIPVKAVTGRLKASDAAGSLGLRVVGTAIVAAEAGMTSPVKGDRLLLQPGSVEVETERGTAIGTWFEITHVEPVAPGGTTVAWMVDVVR